MIYTIITTVELAADSRREAYAYLKHALDNARKAEIVEISSEIIEERSDEDAESPKKLTRQEQLEALADRGTDTWEEYRGER